jgi:hypothetical protein
VTTETLRTTGRHGVDRRYRCSGSRLAVCSWAARPSNEKTSNAVSVVLFASRSCHAGPAAKEGTVGCEEGDGRGVGQERSRALARCGRSDHPVHPQHLKPKRTPNALYTVAALNSTHGIVYASKRALSHKGIRTQERPKLSYYASGPAFQACVQVCSVSRGAALG